MSHRDKRRQIEMRGTMPSHKQVREHWAARLWKKRGFDSLAEFLLGDYCFACGFDNNGSSTERAHILPLNSGGTNRPSNLHCLCSTCHKNSEHLSGQHYWDWFDRRTILDRIISKAASGGCNVWELVRANGQQ
jgi:hypothetical protein